MDSLPLTLAACENNTLPGVYGCPVAAKYTMNGYQMIAIGAWGDFYEVYFWRCVIAFAVTWLVVHYLLIFYGQYLDQQAEERRQAKRTKELPGIYTQNEKDI